MKEYFGLGSMTWLQVALNAVFIGMHAYSYSLNGYIVPALAMGFHAGLILSVIMTDRIFLAPMRQEIADLDEMIARIRRSYPPSKAQKDISDE